MSRSSLFIRLVFIALLAAGLVYLCFKFFTLTTLIVNTHSFDDSVYRNAFTSFIAAFTDKGTAGIIKICVIALSVLVTVIVYGVRVYSKSIYGFGVIRVISITAALLTILIFGFFLVKNFYALAKGASDVNTNALYIQFGFVILGICALFCNLSMMILKYGIHFLPVLLIEGLISVAIASIITLLIIAIFQIAVIIFMVLIGAIVGTSIGPSGGGNHGDRYIRF